MSARFTRREALVSLPALPAAIRAFGQTSSSAAGIRRFISNSSVSYVIEPDGRVKAWTDGHNVRAMSLGLSGDPDRIVPPYVAVDVPPLNGVTAIAPGGSSYAVTGDGRVLAWGGTENGLLGNTPLPDFERTGYPRPPGPMPAPTLSMPKIIDVSRGDSHVLALTADGAVFAWGNGQLGQLGIGSMPVVSIRGGLPDSVAYVPFPVRVPDLDGVTAIAAGQKHSLALMKDGSVRAWGENRYGEVGDGTVTQRKSPVTVRGVSNAAAIAASDGFSVAALADGRVMSWGVSGGLGRPTTGSGTPNPTPAVVPGAAGIIAISAGGQHVVALTSTGRVITWGSENAGQVAHATPEKAGSVPGITTARAVCAAGLSSFATLADGTILVWGMLPSISYRTDGADAEAAHFPVPLQVKGL